MRKDKKIEISKGIPLRYTKDGRRNRIIGFIGGRLFLKDGHLIKYGNYVVGENLVRKEKMI